MRDKMETPDPIISRIISINAVPGNHKLSRSVLDDEGMEEGQKTSKKTSHPNVLRDITNSQFGGDEEGKPKHKAEMIKERWKNEVARERWKLLAKALLKPKRAPCRTCKVKDISVRRFSTFDLVTPNKLEKLDGCWLKYTAKYFAKVYLIEIRHLEPKLTPKELIGFNNTGNICIWPSEEVLTYYVLSKLSAFDGKDVLEVGGGMTCLAGMMLAKYGNVKRIDLTDGNLMSVENVKKIIWRNNLDKSRVSSFQLDWTNYGELKKRYDVVLSSDCLFFDDTRADLVETVWNSLKEDGIALVMAPKRGNTFDCFAKLVAQRGFYCVLLTYYDEIVWNQHLKFKEFVQEYEEDLHYPLLLLLTKSSRGFPLSYFHSSHCY